MDQAPVATRGAIFGDTAMRLTSLELWSTSDVIAQTIKSILRSAPVLRALVILLSTKAATQEAITATLGAAPKTLQHLVIRYNFPYEQPPAGSGGAATDAERSDPLRELAAAVSAAGQTLELRDLAVRLGTRPGDAELTRGEAWTALDAVCVQRGITLIREV